MHPGTHNDRRRRSCDASRHPSARLAQGRLDRNSTLKANEYSQDPSHRIFERRVIPRDIENCRSGVGRRTCRVALRESRTLVAASRRFIFLLSELIWVLPGSVAPCRLQEVDHFLGCLRVSRTDRCNIRSMVVATHLSNARPRALVDQQIFVQLCCRSVKLVGIKFGDENKNRNRCSFDVSERLLFLQLFRRTTEVLHLRR